MTLNRFRDFYKRIEFWNFLIGFLWYTLVAYGLFLAITQYLAPWIFGLWLMGVIG